MRAAVVALVTALSMSTTSPTVTKTEYKAVHRGDMRWQVHHVFDTKGKKMSAWTDTNGVRHQKRKYHDTLGLGTRVEVTYQHVDGRWILQRKGFCVSADFQPGWYCYKTWIY